MDQHIHTDIPHTLDVAQIGLEMETYMPKVGHKKGVTCSSLHYYILMLLLY